MMTEKRRGIATRAKANGSLVRRFRSPIYIPLPYGVSASLPNNLPASSILRAIHFTSLYHIYHTISEGINKGDEAAGGFHRKGIYHGEFVLLSFSFQR
jgi:hypothetical protein